MLHLSVLASTPNRNSLQNPYWGNYGAKIGQPAQQDLYHFCLGCLAGHVPTALSGMPSQMFHISTKSLSIYYGMYIENKLLVCVILYTIRISICLSFFFCLSNFKLFSFWYFSFQVLISGTPECVLGPKEPIRYTWAICFKLEGILYHTKQVYHNKM